MRGVRTVPPREYGFAERMLMSDGYSASRQVEEILLENVPGALVVRRANSTDDRHGTDYWVTHSSGRDLSVDCKVREEDWTQKPEPYRADDLALETWSVVEKEVPGWTRQEGKRTDYILWLWTDTGRWCLVPFPMLCRVFNDNWQAWSDRYKTGKQRTPERNYHSQCVFVPRVIVWREIYKHFA